MIYVYVVAYVSRLVCDIGVKVGERLEFSTFIKQESLSIKARLGREGFGL